jgi:hypothetical protein
MAMHKTVFAESTDVPVARSIGEIMSLLTQAGALAINQDIEGGQVSAIHFVLPYGGGGRLSYKLPARVDPVFKIINGRRVNGGQFDRKAMAGKDREQAARVAWRQLFWWLKSQLALIDLGMVQPHEVMMPYMLDSSGRTFFEVYGPRLLEAGK